MHGKVAAKKLRKSHAEDTLSGCKGARGYAPWNPCAFNVEKWVCERVVSGQLTHGYRAPSIRPSSVPATPLAVFVCAAMQFGVWNGSGQWRPHSATFAVGIYTALSNKLLPFWTCCCLLVQYVLRLPRLHLAKSLSERADCVCATLTTFNWKKFQASGFNM